MAKHPQLLTTTKKVDQRCHYPLSLLTSSRLYPLHYPDEGSLQRMLPASTMPLLNQGVLAGGTPAHSLSWRRNFQGGQSVCQSSRQLHSRRCKRTASLYQAKKCKQERLQLTKPVQSNKLCKYLFASTCLPQARLLQVRIKTNQYLPRMLSWRRSITRP